MKVTTTIPDAECDRLLDKYNQLKAERRPMESVWQDCYHYGLSHRGVRTAFGDTGHAIYDATAMDAVETLAAHIMAELTPAWSPWFRFVPGQAINEEDRPELAAELDHYGKYLASVLKNSNFYTELHQAYIDVVVAGTACLLIEPSAPDHETELRFRALPLSTLALAEDETGQLSTLAWQQSISSHNLEHTFGKGTSPRERLRSDSAGTKDRTILHIYHKADDVQGYFRDIFCMDDNDRPTHLRRDSYPRSPFVAFRWLKVPGQTYGSSPLMKVLPDVRTANKVVELSLRNASIAVAGIWQAEDDGVINPATLQLKPGVIIPKAVGSSGLTPLSPAGRFDLSQLLLDRLQENIRHGMLVDRISTPVTAQQTATEVLTRATEIARVLGATYARLFSECLSPLLQGITSLLADRGRGPRISLNGQSAGISFLSPLHQAHQGRAAQPLLHYIETLAAVSPDLLSSLDATAIAEWLARQLDLPDDLRQSMFVRES